jgi:hypothetical protein
MVVSARYPVRRLSTRSGGNAATVVDDDLTGVARGSATLLEVLAEIARDGFTGQFMAREPDPSTQAGRIECASCHEQFSADAAEVSELRRLEGASDPDEMLAVVALTCPNCSARGALVLNYGPVATVEDAAALLGLDRPTEHVG